MSLALEVGTLVDQRQHDPEGFRIFSEQFESINDYLSSVGLHSHSEPTDCEVWSCDLLHGPIALYYVRRLAAHLDLEGELPKWGDENAPKDSILGL
jgi:hypothetical protein